MYLSKFINIFLPKEVISFRNKELSTFIDKKNLEFEVSEELCLIFQKIKDEVALEENDIALLNAEISKLSVNEVYLHDIIVFILHKLEESIYQKYKPEIRVNVDHIKKFLKDGTEWPKSKEIYTGLLNFQKIEVFEYAAVSNNFFHSPIWLNREIQREKKLDAKLAVNALVLLGQISSHHLNGVDSLPELKKIYVEINQKNCNLTEEKKEIIFFSRNQPTNPQESGETFLATDREKIFYATDAFGQLFVVSHQYNKMSLEPYFQNIIDHTNPKIDTYHHSDQRVWNKFSNDVIKDTAQLLDNPWYKNNFELILRDLGEKRHIIAHELGHRSNDGRTADMGRPRYQRTYNALEHVSEKGAWKVFYPKIKARFEEVLEKTPEYFKYSSYSRDYFYPNGPKDCSTYFRITIEEDFTSFMFQYPSVANKEAFSSKCRELQPLFDKLLNWDRKDIHEFVKDLGRLSYVLYRWLPFSLGTSAIVGWLVRSIASYKGIELGPLQNNEENLPLDWEAFLTFDIEQYAEWFLKHAFKEVRFKEEDTQLNDFYEFKETKAVNSDKNSFFGSHKNAKSFISLPKEKIDPLQMEALVSSFEMI